MKDIIYKYGFAQGVMSIGDFKNEKVSIAKEKCQKQLIDGGLAEIYWEAEDIVYSRTGCKCVVAFCDQWFIEYGNNKQWKNEIENYINNNLECYSSQTKNQFISAVKWLNSWGCTRKFGLGTKLPWDKQWVIESLSDSTIYMAFYTIAHYIMNNSLDGNVKNNLINPNELTEEIFDCIFCDGNINEIDLRIEGMVKIAKLRALIRESLRIYPPAPMAGFRQMNYDGFTIDATKYGGDIYNVPKKSYVGVNISTVGRDPKYWIKNYDKMGDKNVDMEKPHLEFWLDDKGMFNSKQNSALFLAFSLGRRDCVGQALAMKQLMVVLAVIFMKYKVTHPNGKTEFEIKSTLKSVMEPIINEIRFQHRV
eukprot:527218_1